jgi:hypothetical protein
MELGGKSRKINPRKASSLHAAGSMRSNFYYVSNILT